MIILSTQERKDETNVERKFCKESSNLPFAVARKWEDNIRDLTIYDGNGYQYNKSLKRIE